MAGRMRELNGRVRKEKRGEGIIHLCMETGMNAIKIYGWGCSGHGKRENRVGSDGALVVPRGRGRMEVVGWQGRMEKKERSEGSENRQGCSGQRCIGRT